MQQQQQQKRQQQQQQQQETGERPAPASLSGGATSALPDAFRTEFGLSVTKTIELSKGCRVDSYNGPMKGLCAFHFGCKMGCKKGDACDHVHQVHENDQRRAQQEIKKATSATSFPVFVPSSVTTTGPAMNIVEPGNANRGRQPPGRADDDRRSRSRSPSEGSQSSRGERARGRRRDDDSVRDDASDSSDND